MIIRNILFWTGALIVCGAGFTGCNEDEAYKKEMYHPVVYLLSTGSENVYTVVYPFKEHDATGFFSIGCGGSLSNPEEIVIELEPDTVLFDVYNHLNFVVDSAAYAQLLPQSRYEIGAMTVTFPANSAEQYVKVPVKVNQEGLSPDSIYFIPIAIKSVSRYEVNPDKKNMLFRVAVENDYAEQINTTVYYQRGTSVSGSTTTPINGSKILQPLSEDEVRLFAGAQIQTNQSTLAEINQYAIIAKIKSDKTIEIRGYGTIEVEQVEQEPYNRYYTQKDLEGKDIDYIDLSYRFRTKNSAGVFSAWTEIKESLQRLN